MVATADIRWLVVLRLVDMWRDSADLAGVQVEPGWPGDTRKAESIWVEGVDADETIPYMKGGGRQVSDITFDVPVQIWIANRGNLDDTGKRLGEVITAVRDAPKGDPSLQELDGMLDCDVTRTESFCQRTPEGVSGHGRVVIQVRTRIF